MELRRGYQQTEFGPFPEDWSLLTLKELVEPDRGIRYGIVQPGKFDHTGRYMIRGQDYSEAKGWAQPGEVFRVSDEIESRYKNARVKSGDLIITIVGYCGHVEVIPDWLDGANLTQTTARIAINKKRASAIFCRYMLQSPVGRMQVANNLKGAAQPGLNCGDVEKFVLPLPARRDEQSAIATALSEVDALLAAQDALIAKKRAIKQGAMQELLTGKRRLPVFSGKWEVKPLGELCSLKSGEAITAAHIDEHSPFPCYGGNGLRGFTQSHTHEGDYVLIGRQGALCGNVIAVAGRFFASEHALVVTSKVSTDIHWLAYILARANLNQYSESSAQPGLSASKLLLLEFPTPPTKAEQTAIAGVLSSMDDEVAALETQRAKTAQLKQGMMQALLTGRVRLV